MSSWQELVSGLCERWRTDIPEVAIFRAVANAFPELSSLPLPISLRPLALKRRITQVVLREMGCDGFLFESDMGAFTVHLNRAHQSRRRRFTLAHEIGHTLFFELEATGTSSPLRIRDAAIGRRRRQKDVEYLCDVAASEILMPYYRFSRMASRVGVGAAALTQLSSSFGVSLSSAARRLVETSPHRLAVVIWKPVEGSDYLYSRWTAGLRGIGNGRLLLSPMDPAYRVFTRGTPFAKRVWMSLGGPADKYFVDGTPLSGNGQTILTVFVLDKIAEAIVSRTTTSVQAPGQLRLL